MYRRELSKRPGITRALLSEEVREYDKRLNDAVLKIIAGALSVPLGELTQRDQARLLEKARHRTRVLVGMAAVFAILAGLAAVASVVAWNMRNKAESSLKLSQQSRSDADYRLGNAAADSGTIADALAFYASALRNDADNQMARVAALTTLYSQQGIRWQVPVKTMDLPVNAASINIAPNGQWLIFDDGNEVHLRSGKDGGELMRWPHAKALMKLEIIGNGQLIAWTESDGRYSVVRPEAGAQALSSALPPGAQRITLALDATHGIAVLPGPAVALDMNKVFSGQKQEYSPETVLLFELRADGPAPLPVKVEGKVVTLGLSPSGARFAVLVRRGGRDLDELQVRDGKTGQTIQGMPLSGESSEYAWADDEALLLAQGNDLRLLSKGLDIGVELPGFGVHLALGAREGWVAQWGVDEVVLGRVDREGRFIMAKQERAVAVAATFSTDGEAFYFATSRQLSGWAVSGDAEKRTETTHALGTGLKLEARPDWARSVLAAGSAGRLWAEVKDGDINTIELPAAETEQDAGALVSMDRIVAGLRGNDVIIGENNVLHHATMVNAVGGNERLAMTVSAGKVYWWELSDRYADKLSGYESNPPLGVPVSPAVAQSLAMFGRSAATEWILEYRSPSGLLLSSWRADGCSMIHIQPTGGWKGVEVYDETGGIQLFKNIFPGISRALLTDDGRHIVTDSPVRHLQAWEVLSGKEVPEILKLPPNERVIGLANHAAWALTIDDSVGLAWLRSLDGSQSPLPLGRGVIKGTAALSGRHMLCSVSLAQGCRVTAWDLLGSHDQPLFTMVAGSSAHYAFSASGSSCAVVADGRMQVWDLNRGTSFIDEPLPTGLEPEPEFVGNDRFIVAENWTLDIQQRLWMKSQLRQSIVMHAALHNDHDTPALCDFLEAVACQRYERSALIASPLRTRGELVAMAMRATKEARNNNCRIWASANGRFHFLWQVTFSMIAGRSS